MQKTFLKYGLTSCFVLASLWAMAQQDPYYSHFKFNKQAYNSATVGEKDEYICLSAIAHNQWLGFDDRTWIDRTTGEPIQGKTIDENVAPVTFNFNINGQITSKKGTRTHGGVGLSVFDDRVGYMKTTAFKLQAAFFIPIQGNFARLSLGADIGFTQFGFVNPNFRFRQPNDPRIPTTNINDLKPDFGFGAYYKQKRVSNRIEEFYAGVSLSHLNGASYNLASPIKYDLAQHIFFHTGAEIKLANPAFVLEPAVLVKYNSKLQFDFNTTVQYNQTLRGGLGYRQYGTSDAITIMLGYIKNQLQVGYSYDITLSKIRTVSSGTHEVFVGYCFKFSNPPPPPGKYYRGTRWL